MEASEKKGNSNREIALYRPFRVPTGDLCLRVDLGSDVAVEQVGVRYSLQLE